MRVCKALGFLPALLGLDGEELGQHGLPPCLCGRRRCVGRLLLGRHELSCMGGMSAVSGLAGGVGRVWSTGAWVGFGT